MGKDEREQGSGQKSGVLGAEVTLCSISARNRAPSLDGGEGAEDGAPRSNLPQTEVSTPPDPCPLAQNVPGGDWDPADGVGGFTVAPRTGNMPHAFPSRGWGGSHAEAPVR